LGDRLDFRLLYFAAPNHIVALQRVNEFVDEQSSSRAADHRLHRRVRMRPLATERLPSNRSG